MTNRHRVSNGLSDVEMSHNLSCSLLCKNTFDKVLMDLVRGPGQIYHSANFTSGSPPAKKIEISEMDIVV